MRVLFDIVHPAHVHFYRHLIRRLSRAGHECLVVARDKDVTLSLLDAYEIPYRSVGHGGEKSLWALGTELVRRDAFLVRIGREFDPDLVLTRNPSGAQAARLLRSIGVFDTDDGRAVGMHYRLAAPFAHVITTPESLDEELGPKQRKYRGYKALAYLHPDEYTPDLSSLETLGIGADDRYSIIRLVAFGASHDRKETGVTSELLDAVVDRLSQNGRVFVSAEGTVPAGIEAEPLDLPASRFHDALAFADAVVGDSQTVAIESAILGTPSVHISTFAGRLGVISDLESNYGLLRSFPPDADTGIIESVDELVSNPDSRQIWSEKRDRMLADKVNVTEWYEHLVVELGKRT